jgi:hypothetical protein
MSLSVALSFIACFGQVQELHDDFDADFRPRVLAISLDTWQIRPGGHAGMLIAFANEGTRPAEKEYRVFLHIEPEQSCAQILVHADHEPAVPATVWEPGQTYLDGPVPISLGALPEGKYWIHVGLFDLETGRRKLELYWPRQLQIRTDAAEPRLDPLPPEQLQARHAIWNRRISAPVTVKSQHVELQVCRRSGSWRVVDLDTGETWDGGLLQGGAGWADFQADNRRKRAWLTTANSAEVSHNAITVTYKPHQLPQVRCTFRLCEDGRSVEFSLAADKSEEWRLVAASMVDNCLPVTDVDEGHVFAPIYNGWDYHAKSAMMFSHGGRSFTPEATFQMLGLKRNDSAAMLTWNDCYGHYRVCSIVGPTSPIPAAQAILTSLWTQRPPQSWRLSVLGRGSYSEICQAYRQVARERGFLKTWQEKWADRPGARLLAGAADMKPFVLSRSVPGTRYNPDTKERVHVGYTFDQAADMAEHWKKDLGLDRILFVLAGWIHRGYDNQHPDILPAAPECGGNDGLAECSRRVKALGYLFGLHDNYQDLYPDAPSFDLRYTIKSPDGKPRWGGEWAGGRCYLICSKAGLELARRNLPEVKRLFEPTIYFTDTTFAAPLYECADPNHPADLCDDMHYKSALAQYCQEVFGGHGSEHGWEWAVPVTDYFEGNSYASHHSGIGAKDGHAIPMLELIYHDCVAVYAHQGWRTGPTDDTAILRYLVVARMPLYSFGGPRYWETAPLATSLAVTPLAPRLVPLSPRKFEITYRWRVHQPLQDGPRCFVHFTTRDGEIRFQDDHDFRPPLSSWKPGTIVEEEPRLVEIPSDVQPSFYHIRLGAFDSTAGRHGLWSRADDGMTRYTVGYLDLANDGTIRFMPEQEKAARNPTVFARSDNPLNDRLCTTDRFIKNTYEFLSAVNRLCFDVPMVEHKYLRADGSVEFSRFGNGCTVVVNVGDEPYTHEGVVLPPDGFIARAPTLLAFYARRVGGVDYGDDGALFVVTSQDGKPLPESRQVRVYHGFGPPQLALPTNFSAVSCDGQNVAARDGVVLVEVASEALIVPVQQ